MQASAILLFAVCLQVSAASYSQTVSFTGKDVPLKTVFASVKKQTGYGLFYQNGEAATLEGTTTVSLDLKNVTLDLFLQAALRNQPLEYSIEGTTIFVKRKDTHAIVAELSTSGPIPEIKGRVTNDKGEPLANANVTVKRTGRGTVTDAIGNFALHNINTDDIIVITFIGYKPQSLPVQDRTSLTVFMTPTTNDLDKVVVQAYGTTSQRFATGNIGTVRAEDIAKQPVTNVLDAIQGQIPGATITQTSGYASSPVKLEIRGRNTINAGFPSDPLYIIDGVPLTILDVAGNSSYDAGSQGVIQSGVLSPANGQSPFFNINPADIESIEILKDADATAIYGSRASNGIVLITTKKGRPGKTHLDLSMYQGISKITQCYPMLNTAQYIKMREEALSNDGLPVDINNAADLVAWDSTRYTDWQRYAWGSLGKTTDAEASLSGGDSRTTFRIASGYHYIKDILASSGANQRASLSLTLNHKSLNQRLSISLSANYNYTFSNIITTYGATLPPNAPGVFNKNGNLNYDGWAPLNSLFIFSNLLQPYSASTNFLNSNLNINYELAKGLFAKINMGYNNAQSTQTSLTPISSQDPSTSPKGNAAFGYTLFHNLIIEPQIELNKFISKGKLNILVGASTQDNKTNGLFSSGFGYPDDILLSSINNAPTKSVGSNTGQYRYASIFGKLNYNWENKYIINFSARKDGSSRFGPNRQYGEFGSIGAAWILSEEPWFKKNISIISFAKLRGSYGLTGGDQINDYAYLSKWTFPTLSGVNYNGVLPLSPGKHTDSLLHWQKNKKSELALNIAFLQDRIDLEASWYRNVCGDQLLNFPTPAFTGFTFVTTNFNATVENSGWEFNLNAKIIDNTDFKWQVKFNIGINKNKLLSFPNLAQSPYRDGFIIGKPLNLKKLLHYTGVDKQTGLYTFEDKNKDDQITIDYTNQTTDDRYVYNYNPKFDGGLTFNLSYKNWGVSAFFYFRDQKGVNALTSFQSAGSIYNEPLEVFQDHWQKIGDDAKYARFTTMPYDISYSNFQQSDAIFTDASFVRFQNLALSYSFPQNFLKREKIQALQVDIRLQNILVLTKYKGSDPELQNFGVTPLPRIITLGLSCNF